MDIKEIRIRDLEETRDRLIREIQEKDKFIAELINKLIEMNQDRLVVTKKGIKIGN